MTNSIDEALKRRELARKLSRFNLNPNALSSFFGKIDESKFKEGALNRLKTLIEKLQEMYGFFERKAPNNGNLPNISRELKQSDIYIKELDQEGCDVNKINSWITWVSDKYGMNVDDKC